MKNQKVYITSIHRNRLNENEIEVRGYSSKRFEYTSVNLKSESFSHEHKGISFSLRFHSGTSELKLNNGVFADLFSFNNGINSNDGVEISFKEDRLLIKKVGFFYQLKNTLKNVRKEKRYKESIFQISALIYRAVHKNQTLTLFADRIDKANDNAEFLYKEVADSKIKKFFVLRKDSADYKRLKKTYNVISFGSFKHKTLSLIADYIISSHADDFLLNPFLKDKKIFKNFFHYRFIFLQHGVTKDDMSGWLNREGKNIYYLITSSEKEAKSFLTGAYGYNQNEIKVTGMPRFDKLSTENEQKRIVFMPTWRSELAGLINQQTGNYDYNPDFKQSLFFEVINSFLSSKELDELLNRTGYEFVFIPHPNLIQQKQDFFKSEKVKVQTENVDYSQLVQTSEILITDYSSVAFDFGYIKKEVIYFQFDKGNLVPGYFNYKTMGFGPVVESVSGVMDELSSVLTDKSEETSEKYEHRINDFFSYQDKKNSQRIIQLIR